MIMLFQLFEGLSTSLTMDLTAGKVQFSLGGLDFLYFVADPEQPLDHTLRATVVRIPAAKTSGEFDVHRPFVATRTWDHDGNNHGVCMRLSYSAAGKKVSSEEDTSQLFETLRVSPGVGRLGGRSVAICIGGSQALQHDGLCSQVTAL